MKNKLASAVVLVVAAGLGAVVGSGPAQAACPSGRLSLYTGINYGGTQFCYSITGSRGGVSLPPGLRNNVKSVINTAASAVKLYNGETCQGEAVTLGAPGLPPAQDANLGAAPDLQMGNAWVSSFAFVVNDNLPGCGV